MMKKKIWIYRGKNGIVIPISDQKKLLVKRSQSRWNIFRKVPQKICSVIIRTRWDRNAFTAYTQERYVKCILNVFIIFTWSTRSPFSIHQAKKKHKPEKWRDLCLSSPLFLWISSFVCVRSCLSLVIFLMPFESFCIQNIFLW